MLAPTFSMFAAALLQPTGMYAAAVLQPALSHRVGARAISPRMGIGGFDEFGDPLEVVVGGNVVAPRATDYPSTLELPAYVAKATITPFAEWTSIIFAPLEGDDIPATFFVGVALLLGPDFVLAPAGLVSDEGIRPGFALEAVVGEVIDADAQWLKDRKENLACDAPLKVKAPIFALFLAAGLLVSRFLLLALEDPSFVTSTGIISCIGGGFLELLREQLPTREERDLENVLTDEFMIFSADALVVGGRCHEREIVAAFRKRHPRYRKRDMSRTVDGVSVDDDQIGDLVGKWNMRMGRPGDRTKTGYWKGISLAPAPVPAGRAVE